MDPSQVLQLVAVLWSLVPAYCAESKKGKSIMEALANADRYAGGFTDSFVSDAWERAEDGWVRGGYTLVSGATRTDVRYAVNPLGEMRVLARRPALTAVDSKKAKTKGRLAIPALRRSPLFQRLHLLERAEHLDGHGLDDDDLDYDDDDVFDDWPSIFPSDWSSPSFD